MPDHSVTDNRDVSLAMVQVRMTGKVMNDSRASAIAVVLFSALMWAFWWFPVHLLEAAGLTGAWVGVAMSGAAFALSLTLLPFTKGRVSPRAIAGAVLIGAAVTLYTISVSYTVFIRAVLIFYVAPAWSTMIECAFFGRRWALRAAAAIACSMTGLLLISRGEFSFEGVGAIGDWMALFGGMAWSAGAALVFSSREAEFARTLSLTLLGSIVIALLLLAVWGDIMGETPGITAVIVDGWQGLVISGLYLGVILGCTMWGAVRLAPAAMTYLLSVEIVGGVLAAALILGEPFGWFEALGTLFIIGAVFVELTRRQDV